MNLNPISPFSGKAMSDCDEREKDAWCAKLCGLEPYWIEHYGWYCKDKPAHYMCPDYGTSWAAAGPLMDKIGAHLEFWRGLENSRKITINCWEQPNHAVLAVDEPTTTQAVRNLFIIYSEFIAATHAAQREGGVS